MKLASLIVVSALMFTAPVAQAADMALKAPPPQPAQILSWTGLYIGVNAGGGWASTEWEHNHLSDCATDLFNVAGCDTGRQSSNSFIGGGQIGARVQTGQFVFGIEGTADYANFHPSTIDPPLLAALGATAIDSTRLRGLYTATAQAGIAWDRELWYVKGGWAGSRVTQTLNLIGGDVGTVSHNASGWTIGTGLEYRLATLPNFSVGLEYDYMRLRAGDASTCTNGGHFIFNCTTLPPLAVPLMFSNFHANVNELLVRANYTFNWMGIH